MRFCGENGSFSKGWYSRETVEMFFAKNERGKKEKEWWATHSSGFWISIILLSPPQTQLCDSAESSSRARAALQAFCTWMQSWRTGAVINKSSSPALAAIKPHLKSLKSAHKSRRNCLLLSMRYCLGSKPPCPRFSQTWPAIAEPCLWLAATRAKVLDDRDRAHSNNLMLLLGNFSPQIDPFELAKLARKHYFPLHSPK